MKKIPEKIRIEKLNNKIIAITLGDPFGIGPEIIQKSIKDFSFGYPVVIIGDLEYYKDRSIALISEIEEIQESGNYFLDIKKKEIKTEPSFDFVKRGIGLALEGKVQALVTAPISKVKWFDAGVKFRGHTEFFTETLGLKDYCMFFWSESLKVALLTHHIPLKDVFFHLKESKIIKFIRFVRSELTRLLKRDFIFLVSGLNPHSGEGGSIGNEEIEMIIPAIKTLETEMDIRGPFPPDTIFLKAEEIKNSVVVSWYHDQGLIPFKLLNIHSGVNLTLGLPFVRTAPDHGTAFDIAGKGIANPGSMKKAIKLAEIILNSMHKD